MESILKYTPQFIRFFLILFVGSIFIREGTAQPRVQVQKDLQILSDSEMSGRGFQQQGHLRAAHYIAQRFREIGLQPFYPDETFPTQYFQPFTFDLNVCDSVALFADKTRMIPGKDYIVHPQSGSVSGLLKFKNLDFGMGEDWEANPVKNNAVMVRLGYPDFYRQDEKTRELFHHQTGMDFKLDMAAIHQPALMFVRRDKLTASLSSARLPYGLVEILPGRLSRKTHKIQAYISTVVQRMETQNVLAWIPGKKYPDSVIVIAAHYDHLGSQSEAIFTGANDNASGVAFMLALATDLMRAEKRPEYSVLCIAFGAEEAGLKGSLHFVRQMDTLFLGRIRYMLNFDLMGNGDEGITLVAGTDFPGMAAGISNSLKSVSQAGIPVELRKNAPNSDHYPFVKSGIPAIFTYTKGGPPHYHDVYDTYDQVRFPVLETLLETYIHFITSY